MDFQSELGEAGFHCCLITIAPTQRQPRAAPTLLIVCPMFVPSLTLLSEPKVLNFAPPPPPAPLPFQMRLCAPRARVQLFAQNHAAPLEEGSKPGHTALHCHTLSSMLPSQYPGTCSKKLSWSCQYLPPRGSVKQISPEKGNIRTQPGLQRRCRGGRGRKLR